MKCSIRTAVVFCSLASLLLGIASAQEPEKGRRVMAWVPPYAVGKCKKRLDQSFDGSGIKDGLTHLGLQFWQPTEDGGLELVQRYGLIDESTISAFRTWGDSHGIQIMLCVYNGTPEGWDWKLAKTAFDTHRERLVGTLVAETVRLKLDGVDIDLEGKGNLDGDREAFVRFIKELSERLHAKGKELTIDTFAYKWNAPNQSWWPALLPHVDGLNVMGYSETGAGAAEWRSYDFLKAAAGKHSSKLLIGVPANAAAWQNVPAQKHLAWVYEDASVGLAIWDAQLTDPVWRTREMWQAIEKIKKGAKRKAAERPAAVNGSE